MLWEIDWRIIQRMLIDMPDYVNDDKKQKKEEINLTEENSADLMKQLRDFQ